MSETISCIIPQKTIAYDIVIQQGLLKDHHALHTHLTPLGSRFAVIATEKIARLYAEPLCQALTAQGMLLHLFRIPDGEHSKSRQVKEQLENQMFEKKLGRDTGLIALGGGVVTDLGGYIAATYCRGLPLVMIPTTLLGMVDASIGGKTGVNVPYGKNLIGSTYQPKKVLIDPATLHSLPLKELKNGIVEMLKHGLITDAAYFTFLEENLERLLALDPVITEKAIAGSCLIKKTIVEQDEKEEGKRRLLNFGHTVAHAIETLTHYTMAHGEAVALGILVEAHIAMQLGQLDQASYVRISKVIIQHALTGQVPSEISSEAILQAMVLDKKSLNGKPRFVILERIGSCLSFGEAYCTRVDQAVISKSLKKAAFSAV